MCGIVAYVGAREAVPLLLEGLRRLEYRGYDSVGVAIQSGASLRVAKLAGRVLDLGAALAREPLCGTSGIAHTRWATHGAPTQLNAHPHIDCSGRIALVHNGIIENADALRAALERGGHRFVTATDTETLAHLIEDAPGTLEQRVIDALGHVEGTYGLAVLCAEEPGKLVVARRGSPLLVGIGEQEFFVASDASAVLEHTRQVVYLDDGDIAVLTPTEFHVIDSESHVQLREVDDIAWDLAEIELGGHPHFMHKEICEQAETVRATLRGRLLHEQGTARLDGLNLVPGACREIGRVVIVGCGTSWHAGLVGRHLIEALAGIPVQVEDASKYRHQRPPDLAGTLTIAVSQSGETADTLEAMRVARGAGSRVVGVVNVVGSTIAREADGGIYLHAGPEIGVASTKAFTSQIVALALLALYLGRERGLSVERGREVACRLSQLPQLVTRTLALEPQLRVLAHRLAAAPHALYLGRGVNFPVALEGALKLKAISAIQAEGYAAAELKQANLPVVFVAPRDAVYPKVVANMHEVNARGGRIIAITTEGNGDLSGLVEAQLRVPETLPLLSPVLTSIPLQLLAYHSAVLKGCDVDRPRHLATSATVE
jgi:glucosamine--fructose-6-phosphate aminotransferase (isomerizing)